MTRTRCAVLGDPVEHSLSPTLHRAAYDLLGLDWSYQARRVPSGTLPAFLAGLDASWRGLSLTMPLKREVLALAGEVSPRARLAGAANTLVLEGSHTSYADNTDLPGAVAAIREVHDGPVRLASVLGAGATAASTGLALCELGAEQVTLLARDAGRARATQAVIAAHPSRPLVLVSPLDGARVVGDVLVSTVPVSAQTPDLVAGCSGVQVVLDVVYDPWPTPLASAVLSDPDRVLVSGLDLLAHQAVLQLQLFTGEPVCVDVVRAAGQAELRRRTAACIPSPGDLR